MNSVNKRFNIVDFIIVVVLIGTISGLILRYNIVERIANAFDNDTMSVNVIAKDLSPEIAKSVKNGQKFHILGSDISLGKINNIRVGEGERVISAVDGSAAVVTDPTVRELMGNFEVEGSLTDDGFLIDGIEYIAPGKELVIQCNDTSISVIITEIK